MENQIINETAIDTGVHSDWYVDLTKEEFIHFRLLLAKVNGPLRHRISSFVMSLACSVLLAGVALWEWFTVLGREGMPDPVMLVAALLALLPGLFSMCYVPVKMTRTAARQYDRSVEAGMTYCGRLVIQEGRIEKIGPTAIGSVPMDQRTLFIESEKMMILVSAGSPAVVLPGRCMTTELAAAVRQAADRLPPRNRRFIDRLQAQDQVVAPPPEKEPPEEKWACTFTYTPEEYATVLKGLIKQHFVRVAPWLAVASMMGGLFFGYIGETFDPLSAIGHFLLIAGIMVLFNLVLPLSRVKRQAATLTAHDLTMQVRLDTMALRFKAPKSGENPVLWCDVDHVYDGGEFVEIVHNKKASLYIPKRAIADLSALDEAVKTCRGK